MRIMYDRINLNDYEIVYNPTTDTISLPQDKFWELLEDVEDYAYLDGHEADQTLVSHKQVLVEMKMALSEGISEGLTDAFTKTMRNTDNYFYNQYQLDKLGKGRIF